MSVKPWDLLNPKSEWASKEVQESRYDICKSCPELINATKQCKQCGCFMHLKTKLQLATCPLGKWGGEESISIQEYNDSLEDNTSTIFINIPSYKDPELFDTVEDFILKAKNPERVFFGITNQYIDLISDKIRLSKLKNVLVDFVSPGSIIGCQPARKNSHKFYKNQDYYLNMDSHMRAIQNWDVEIIREYEKAKNNYGQLVFTAYAPAYDVNEDGTISYQDVNSGNPTFYMSQSNINTFMDTGTFQMSTQYSNPGRNVTSPYISGHFFFTESDVIKNVPFVDQVTFTEEEPLMAIRFFTAGYQIVTPQKVFVFHRYGRPNRSLFWEDFPERFHPNDVKSKMYFRDLVLGNISGGIFDKRSISDYEEYAGIYFKEWRLEDRLIKGLPSAPPLKQDTV